TDGPSLVQVTLRASPHGARWPALSDVIGFHPPIGPAQISGACCQSERIAASTLPLREIAWLPNVPPWIASSPCHSRSSLPLARSSAPSALPPPTYSATSICDGDSQLNALADDRRSGVRSVGRPPAAGIVNTSPPVNPWSLISPLMNPIAAPSGDH